VNFQMSPEKAFKEMNENTLCIFPAHLLGKYSKVCGIMHSYDGRFIPVLEDACEAMGGQVGGRKFGTLGLAGSFSMYAVSVGIWNLCNFQLIYRY